MLEKLLNRSDVSQFIEEIETNDRYFQKAHEFVSQKDFFMSRELALFIFYDALYKYQVVIEDLSLFDEYMEQLERLYRKLDDFENIRIGIHKLICKMAAIKLSVDDIHSEEARETLVSYVYDRYIENGYFIHGFSSCYYDEVLEKGFVPGEYKNYYSQFQEINQIFEKYNISAIIPKDFSDNTVYFTDDFIMGCYYSFYSPMFFYDFLINKKFDRKIQKDFSLVDDYMNLVRSLKKFMKNHLFSGKDRKRVLEIVQRQWELLSCKNHYISLLLVKRKDLSEEKVLLKDYLTESLDVYEIIDHILSSKYTNVACTKGISKEEEIILSLKENEEEKMRKMTSLEKEYLEKEEKISFEFSDVYGNVSLFLILGSFFISLGVLITIFSILGGR